MNKRSLPPEILNEILAHKIPSSLFCESLCLLYSQKICTDEEASHIIVYDDYCNLTKYRIRRRQAPRHIHERLLNFWNMYGGFL